MGKNIWSAVLGVLGGILILIGSITKYAYTTGYSYIVTAAEEQATIGKAETCLYIGIGLIIVALIIYIKGAGNKE